MSLSARGAPVEQAVQGEYAMKVLIVDPDWRFAQQITSHLEAHAHLVVHQSTGIEALDRIRHWGPELVILAAEAAENGLVESIQLLQPRPAVLLTEYLDRYDRAWRVWQKGGDDLLIKPVFCWDDVQEAMVTALENAAVGRRIQPHTRASA
jgi:CheY-like chemotaxis protein